MYPPMLNAATPVEAVIMHFSFKVCFIACIRNDFPVPAAPRTMQAIPLL
jgi:hypothetical protein